MHTFALHTLVDITENGVLKAEFPFTTKSGELVHDRDSLITARNQQANFTTLLQLLQIRGNITWEQPPIRTHENIANWRFGSAYQGRHMIWTFLWQTEQLDVYALNNDRTGQLIEDFDQIPVVNFCKETATFPASAFITQDPMTINTYFTYIADADK